MNPTVESSVEIALRSAEYKRLPLASIIVPPRMRELVMEHVLDLKDSIESIGFLMHPIVVSHENILIAGEHRLAAVKLIGWSDVPCAVVVADEEDRLQMELEENVKRKEMRWQDKCVGVLELHELNVRKASKNKTKWFQSHTGALLGQSQAHVSYCLAIGDLIKKKDEAICKCTQMSDAVRLLVQRKEDEMVAAKAGRFKTARTATQERAVSVLPNFDKPTAPTVDPTQLALEESRRNRQIALDYLDDPEMFGDYKEYPEGVIKWIERIKADRAAHGEGTPVPETKGTTLLPDLDIPIQRAVISMDRLYFGDALDYLTGQAPESLDHIITDPPYGLDIDLLSQDQENSLNQDRIRETHDVDDNVKLIKDFIPLAYRAMRPNRFLAMWYIIEYHQWIQDELKAAGFTVQIWPYVWCKTKAGNAQAHVNMTKAMEFCMIARKGQAKLNHPMPLNYCIADATDERRKLGNHPFVKPAAAWRDLIDGLTLEGQEITDPFGGVGSCPLVALDMNRQIRVCEKDAKHYNQLLLNIKEKANIV